MALGSRNRRSFRNSKGIWLIILILLVAVFAGTLMLLNNLVKREYYYVLNQPVAQRAQITTEMLTPVETSAGTQPDGLSLTDVQEGDVYSRIPLQAGDLLTLSNTGGLEDIAVGIPDDWVVTSIQVNADNASAGRIRRGVYFDLMVVDKDGAFFPFVNLLALDTTVSLDSATSSEAVDTEEARTGQTELYYVGLPVAESAKLQTVMAAYGDKVKLVLSPRANEYQKPDIAGYTGEGAGGSFVYTPGDPIFNGGEGTNPTFEDMDRDKFGRPTQELECRAGNNPATAGECDGSTQSQSSGSGADAPDASGDATVEGSDSPTND